MFSHGNAFHSQAEGKAGVFFRINFHGFQHIGINHAAAAEFHPFGTSVRIMKTHIKFRTRFGKWKKTRAKASFHVGTEKGFGKLINTCFQINHGDMFIHHQTFNLMEHEAVRGVHRIRAVNPARSNNAYRRLL